MSQNLVSDVSRSTFEIGAAQLRHVAEMAPKSLFLCVNRSHRRYDFSGGAKTIRQNVNIALVTVPTHNVRFLSLEAGRKPTGSRQLCSAGARVPTSFPGFSPTRPRERERERPWKTLVTCLQNKINSEGGVLCLTFFFWFIRDVHAVIATAR